MNQAHDIGPWTDFEAASVSTMRRIRGDIVAANEEAGAYLPAIDGIVAWARNASGKDGFIDTMAAFPSTARRPAARELHKVAHAARSKAIAALIAVAVLPIRAVLRRALATYRVYREARETARALRELDDRTLHDMGYDRSEIESVAIETSVARAR